ncbi:MAG: DNA mismatch repair protein MutS, partial [Isosphaeraceae bacterium]
MKAFLMHADRDFDLGRELPPNVSALIQDLELGTLTGAMAAGDRFLSDVAQRAVLASMTDPEAITYRQLVL